MAKRYVFWRMPTGQPYKKDDLKFAPHFLLAKMGESAKLNTNDGITWPFLDMFQNELIVRSVTVVLDPDGNELNETDSWLIASQAIRTVISKQGSGKPILPSDFIASGDKVAAAYFRQSVVDYILLTSLSVENLPARRIRICDCEISALANRGKYTFPESLTIRRHDPPFSKHLKSTKYLAIAVRTSGRSEFEATDKALDAINLLRGLWTLFSTRGQWTMRMGSTKQIPIGVIHMGPVHTLHQLDGSPAVDKFWYEPSYSGDMKLYKPKGGWKSLEKLRQRAVRQMKHLPFGAEVERLIMRYIESLDQVNLDVAFVQMWSILEKVTDTIGANYDETIQRATWIFKDRENAKEKLKFLRVQRNQYIHSAKTSENNDQAAYMVKSFIDPHLVRLISNEFEVDSIAEYGKFLALPTNISTLEKHRDQIKRAIHIRKPRESS
ncbi:MAG: hypothetical protein IH899_00835 [Planctomycetes bacterium]|nr:hypothetical protein [Planctomycetota bacterium]